MPCPAPGRPHLRHLRHPRAVVVYLAHTNQTVEAMHTAVNDAKRTGAFPGWATLARKWDFVASKRPLPSSTPLADQLEVKS